MAIKVFSNISFRRMKYNLQLFVHLKLNKTFFPVEEYTTLRSFFANIVKKESEKIVFRKIQ